MCRLYTFRATAPRQVECELLCKQNSLLKQSRHDAEGQANAHGWGLGAYTSPWPTVVRQPDAAFASERFRLEATRVHARNVVAHVRRASVGRIAIENTHPFTYQRWLFAHNGTIPGFDRIRVRMRRLMAPSLRRAIRGDTDSEHLFFLLLSMRAQTPHVSLSDIVQTAVRRLIVWCSQEDVTAPVTANLVLTNGENTVGLCYGRPLYYVVRRSIHPCEICECQNHITGNPPSVYRAVVVASEPVTGTERWKPVPTATLFFIGPDLRLRLTPLFSP